MNNDSNSARRRDGSFLSLMNRLIRVDDQNGDSTVLSKLIILKCIFDFMNIL
jgi:hypothetical protein